VEEQLWWAREGNQDYQDEGMDVRTKGGSRQIWRCQTKWHGKGKEKKHKKIETPVYMHLYIANGLLGWLIIGTHL
jgi:hypothetical protein